jgi:hypothetical protein
MLVASWRNWLAEARLRRWRRPLEPKSVEQPATSVDGAAMHGRTAISLRWPRAALLGSLNKRATFLFPARCGYRSGNASAENLVQSRQMRTSISLRWRSPMLDILARCNFKPKLACKTANNQKTYGKLKTCIGFAADVRSHTSRNNKKLHAFRILRASLYRATTNNCRTQAGDRVIQKLVAELHKVMLRTEALQKSDNENRQGTDLQQSASLCQASASAPLSMHPLVTN